MTSLQFLMEAFLADARFPDEKFWDKNGDPIHPDAKGPPRGTIGKTHGDIGAVDQDDQPSTSPVGDLPSELQGHEITGCDREDVAKWLPQSIDPTEDPDDPDSQADYFWDYTLDRPIQKARGKYWIWRGLPGDDFHDWTEAK